MILNREDIICLGGRQEKASLEPAFSVWGFFGFSWQGGGEKTSESKSIAENGAGVY